jgi:two-component system sensor histidine kinase UhpB
MKNQHKIHDQLRYLSGWGRRKTVLLIVLTIALILLLFSFFKIQQEQSSQFFQQSSNSGNGWAYPGIGIAVTMVITIFILLLREISGSQKIVEELKMQWEHYRITVGSISEGLITTCREGEIQYMNPAAERLTGWSNDEAKHHSLEKVYDVIHEEYGKPFEHIISRILRKKELVVSEDNTLLNTKDLKKIAISNSGAPLFDASGDISGAVLVFKDNSENKKIETALLESEKQYRTLIQNLPQAIYTCDAKGFINLYNKAAIELWGKEPVAGKDQWCGSWKMYNATGKYLPPETRPMAVILKGGKSVYGQELSIQRPDGNYSHVLSYPTAIFDSAGNLTGAINMLIDITQGKIAETVIKQSEEKYRALIEQASDAIFISNRDGNILEANYSASKMLGFTNEELATMNSCELYAEGDVNTRPYFLEKLAQGEKIMVEKNFTPRLGSLIPVEITAKMLSDGRIMAIARDISERKKAEIKTAKAVERYDILAEATSDTIWDWDIVQNRMLFNSKITRMFGYQVTEVEDVKTWRREKIHADDLPLVMDAYYGTIENTNQTIQLEYRFRCADGKYKHIYDRAFVIYDNPHQKPLRMIGAMQDITQAKEEERRIAKAIIDAQEQERRFIGEELHDNVNQLLASSLLTLGVVKHYQHDQEKVNEFADVTKEHIQNALNEIRKLSHELVPAAFDGSTLKDIFESLLSEINVKNQFIINFQFNDKINGLICEDLKINLYRILQEQVKNILTYADANLIELTACCSEDHVVMRTYDNGKGFDPRKVKAGIGLSNMRRRVESFGGKFNIISQPGKGCEMVVEIPTEKSAGISN